MKLLPELLVKDAAAWRAWLEKHHAKKDGVRLILHKKGGAVTTLTYAEALHEALCFGWIDGQIGRRDEGSFFQRFTPRTSRSAWSANNVAHVARLTKEGRMRPAGIAAVESAKSDGRWARAYAGPASATVPDDLAEAIEKNRAAKKTFALLTAQNRYALIYRLTTVKGAATRAKKIAGFVEMLARGEALHPQKNLKPTLS